MMKEVLFVAKTVLLKGIDVKTKIISWKIKLFSVNFFVDGNAVFETQSLVERKLELSMLSFSFAS